MPKKPNKPMQRMPMRPPGQGMRPPMGGMGRPGMPMRGPMPGGMGMPQRTPGSMPPQGGQGPKEPMIPLSGVVAIVQAANGKAQPQQRPPGR